MKMTSLHMLKQARVRDNSKITEECKSYIRNFSKEERIKKLITVGLVRAATDDSSDDIMKMLRAVKCPWEALAIMNDLALHEMELQSRGTGVARRLASTPILGELLLCVVLRVERQDESLADFEEKFTTLWVPRFGVRIAKVVYILVALQSAAAVIRITALAAFMDFLCKIWSRLPTGSQAP